MSGDTYLGIDVGIERGCAYAVIDAGGDLVDAGWFDSEPPRELLDMVRSAREAGHSCAVAIDAPREPVPEPRGWFWDGSRGQWRTRRSEAGAGRHCEVVIKALGLGNPQWTPLATQEIPPWMTLGFRLFRTFGECGALICEVFPTASYAIWEESGGPRIRIAFGAFRRGPKDLLDACVAAATVREFVLGRGWEAGGGDGLGTIVLPAVPGRMVPGVLVWPEAVSGDPGGMD